MNSKALGLLRRAARVQRMHTFNAHHRQTVGEHSYGVIAILMHICHGTDLLTVQLMKAAMIHDAPEADLGDIPAPAKWDNATLEAAMKTAEGKVYDAHALSMQLPDKERDLLKFADYMELAMFSLEEVDMGNRNILDVCRNAIRAIEFKGIQTVTKLAEELYAEVGRLYQKEVWHGTQRR